MEPAQIPAIKAGCFLWHEAAEVPYVEPAVLKGHLQLRCAFTTRHAGRMGTYHRVVSVVLDTLYNRFAVSPEHLYAILGPGIGEGCYRLDERAVAPVRDRFDDWEGFFVPQEQGFWTMRLVRANEAQLYAAGVPAAHVSTAYMCTACHHEHFYSHRAEGREAGRGMGVAALPGVH